MKKQFEETIKALDSAITQINKINTLGAEEKKRVTKAVVPMLSMIVEDWNKGKDSLAEQLEEAIQKDLKDYEETYRKSVNDTVDLLKSKYEFINNFIINNSQSDTSIITDITENK